MYLQRRLLSHQRNFSKNEKNSVHPKVEEPFHRTRNREKKKRETRENFKLKVSRTSNSKSLIKFIALKYNLGFLCDCMNVCFKIEEVAFCVCSLVRFSFNRSFSFVDSSFYPLCSFIFELNRALPHTPDHFR